MQQNQWSQNKSIQAIITRRLLIKCDYYSSYQTSYHAERTYLQQVLQGTSHLYNPFSSSWQICTKSISFPLYLMNTHRHTARTLSILIFIHTYIHSWARCWTQVFPTWKLLGSTQPHNPTADWLQQDWNLNSQPSDCEK